jgi:hypothetical protein
LAELAEWERTQILATLQRVAAMMEITELELPLEVEQTSRGLRSEEWC